MVLSNLDRSLLERCLTGSEAAWGEFVDRFLPLVVHVVNHTGKQRFGALPDVWRDDLVLDVLLSMVEDDFAVLRRFQGNSSLGSYLVVVARRIAARKLNRMRRSDDTATGRSVSPAVAQPQDLLRWDQTEQVQKLISRLPQSEAKAIRMYHLEHCSPAEIGHHLGIPESTVGTLLRSARGKMRSMLSEDKTA